MIIQFGKSTGYKKKSSWTAGSLMVLPWLLPGLDVVVSRCKVILSRKLQIDLIRVIPTDPHRGILDNCSDSKCATKHQEESSATMAFTWPFFTLQVAWWFAAGVQVQVWPSCIVSWQRRPRQQRGGEERRRRRRSWWRRRSCTFAKI